MSRLTGADALGLFDAYQAVYAPQELTEEQVWEEVEYWVDNLMREGYDLSDYTWEEMYESYLEEILGMPDAQNAGAALRQKFGQARRAVGNTISDVAGSAARGATGKTTTSKNPISQAYNAVARGVTTAPRAAASFVGGVLSGKPGATNPSAKPAAKPERQGPYVPERLKKGPTATTPPPANRTPGVLAAPARPSAGAPARPAATAVPRPAATASAQTGDKAKDMDTWAKANPKLAAASAERDRTRGTSATTNPLMKDMKSRLPAPKTPSPTTSSTAFSKSTPSLGSSTPEVKSAGTSSGSAGFGKSAPSIGSSAFKPSPAAAAPTPTPTTAAATPAAKPALKKPIVSGFDMFDVVKGYLIGEGYADTEEAALAIMTNMSEEWKQSIIKSI